MYPSRLEVAPRYVICRLHLARQRSQIFPPRPVPTSPISSSPRCRERVAFPSGNLRFRREYSRCVPRAGCTTSMKNRGNEVARAYILFPRETWRTEVGITVFVPGSICRDNRGGGEFASNRGR